ncbi:MAG TPA: DUF2470 domain-containing protein [Rhodopila sp.]|uniref:HugZ family pyridoxamine 5'-phosphate oxidase n=1 Tax=Rhodopila sp. TaxID=2480087 RepID=UPI002C1E5541|nr:DUF2470 domain-containing protein [Rhodopila sp.]HVY15303.1 DUF2470 domain-containing protein [Rhodopila sp.]
MARPADDDGFDPAWSARCLLRAVRVGTLATSAGGHPFASLVTPACAPDLSVLMLLSRLSPHTRHLMADGRCSILVTGTPETENPQTAPRVTLVGSAAPIADEALLHRYLAIHPYASQYAGFGDFGLWRLTPAEAQVVGGFARARRLGASDLVPAADAVAAIATAAEGIMAHCNQDHPDALAAIAGPPGNWRMVTVDTDGFDLARAETVRRFAWAAPVGTAAEIRGELVRMTRAARA